jgi:MFS family permease
MGSGLARLLLSSALSNLADGVFQTVLPLVTLGVTRDPAAFASVTVAVRLPWLLSALPAGVIADRLDRRRTMATVDVGRALLIGALAAAAAAHSTSLLLLCTAAFLLGIGETLFDTAAQSILPSLVDAEDLATANGRLYAVELVLNNFVGPPLGGFLVGVGAVAALGGVAGAYLLAAGALLLIAGSFRPARDGPRQSLRTDIAEGLRYLFGHRVLRTLALLTGLSNMTGIAALTVLPLYAVRPGPMGLSDAGYGILLSAAAFGSLAGSALAAPAERALGRTSAIVVSFALFVPVVAAPAATTSPYLVGAALAVYGAASVVWNVITVSLRQRIVPDHLLGRVNAGYRFLSWGSMPLGAAAGGLLGDALGLRAVFVIAGVATAAQLPLLLPLRTEGLGDAPEPSSDAPAND